MATSVKAMLDDANATVPKLSAAEAIARAHEGDTLLVDVRDPSEVRETGLIQGAINVSRGMLEFRADPESSFHDPAFRKDRTILLFCASGGRSALAGKVLKEMGYTSVYNVGGHQDLEAAGADVDRA